MRTTTSLQVPVAEGFAGPGHLVPSVYGALVLGALVLSVATALGVVLLRRGALRRRATASGYFAGAVVCAVLAAASVVAWRTGQATATEVRGTPVVSQVRLGGTSVPVTVVPNRPGLNLVGIGAADATAGRERGRLTAGRAYPGSDRTWVTVELPPGQSQVWVSAYGATASLAVDTGDRRVRTPTALGGADGPECSGAAVGAALAGSRTPFDSCPADRLDPVDAAALRSVVGFLAHRGERGVALADDGSPRAVAAAEVVRAAARRTGLDVARPGTARRPLIVVAGWAGADTAVRDVAAGRITAQGTYLAPWLLTPTLLQPSAGQVIPLRYAPRGNDAMRYLAALGERLPGELPAAAGYDAWRRAHGTTVRSPARLYAVAVPYVPGSGGAGHHHADGTDWLPGGMIVPVTGPLKEPA
ncbi:hypothetical protein [Streptomyces sp. TP-A0356]|uniref:hypothetical protein n=1 Tax=Streptomyces sp. TP-A0356 TaxID=1359208 RepID=UPI0006E340D3|nr:hypothetical protein [Streptomyces sp. TP-A0356]